MRLLISAVLGSVAMTASVAALCQNAGKPGRDLIESQRDGVTVVSYLTPSWPCRAQSVGAEFEYGAAGVAGVQFVRLGLNTVYTESPKPGAPMRIEADGKTHELGPTADLGFFAPRRCRNLALAQGVRVDRALFLRIMEAKTLGMFVGDTKIEIRDPDLAGLRALASRLR